MSAWTIASRRAPLAGVLGAVCLLAGSVAGCRGGVSEDPPLHLAPDMDNQLHRRPQSSSKVFNDGRAGRRPEPHTVARGHLKIDRALYRGLDASGQPITRIPFEVTQEVLERGEERFNIYCSPCHDKTGSGNGLVAQRSGGAFADMPSFALARLHAPETNDGNIFRTITEGKARMPSYAAQIPERDRWAIVAWVRVLQEVAGPAPAAPAPAPQGSAPPQGGSK